MGDRSAIEWTDATWNPTTGCDRSQAGLRQQENAVELVIRQAELLAGEAA